MDAKNFLFCSLDAALIGDVAWQVHREGHDVRYYIEAESDREIADGFVPNMYYRDDIGERWVEGDGDRLQAWGYI